MGRKSIPSQGNPMSKITGRDQLCVPLCSHWAAGRIIFRLTCKVRMEEKQKMTSISGVLDRLSQATGSLVPVSLSGMRVACLHLGPTETTKGAWGKAERLCIVGHLRHWTEARPALCRAQVSTVNIGHWEWATCWRLSSTCPSPPLDLKKKLSDALQEELKHFSRGDTTTVDLSCSADEA